jgi:hypothetical protein
MTELSPQERLEEEKKAEGLQKMLHGQTGKWTGKPEMRQTFQETQGWWLELLIGRYRQGKNFEEILRHEGEAGLATVLESAKEFLKGQLGKELYEVYPEKPTRQEAERCRYFYQVVKARGIAVPGEAATVSH